MLWGVGGGGRGKDTEPPGPDKGQRAPLDGLNDGSSLSHSQRVEPPARARASRVAWCRPWCETPRGLGTGQTSARPSSFLPPSPDLTSPPLPSHWSRGSCSQDGVPFLHKTLSLGGKEGPWPIPSGFIGREDRGAARKGGAGGGGRGAGNGHLEEGTRIPSANSGGSHLRVPQHFAPVEHRLLDGARSPSDG